MITIVTTPAAPTIILFKYFDYYCSVYNHNFVKIIILFILISTTRAIATTLSIDVKGWKMPSSPSLDAGEITPSIWFFRTHLLVIRTLVEWWTASCGYLWRMTPCTDLALSRVVRACLPRLKLQSFPPLQPLLTSRTTRQTRSPQEEPCLLYLIVCHRRYIHLTWVSDQLISCITYIF